MSKTKLQKESSDKNLIYLNRNEYFFKHPPDVIQALSLSFEEKFISHYASTKELSLLKKTLAIIYHVNENSVLLGHGAEDIFVKLLSWFRKEKSSIVMEDFSWTNYLHIAEGFQYDVHTVPVIQSESGFKFDKDGFIRKLGQLNSSIVFITTPNNPTGHDVAIPDLVHLVSLFPNHLFIIDTVYNEIVNVNYAQLFSLKNCIFVGSFSKFFGLPGLRLGYALGQLPNAFQLNLGLQPSTIYAALAALNNYQIYKKNRDEMLSFSRKLFLEKSEKFKVYETHAPFFLIKVYHKEAPFHLAEEKSGVVPKIIYRDKEIYVRFGLGPKEIQDKVAIYLNTL